jgi:hypothetical protein
LAILAPAVAGCGSGGGGEATLWVTRDQGASVLLVRTVEAGQTALQALDREAEVTTSYGCRFVDSIDGVHGDLSARRDWFYFVNGIEGDRSAAEYRLHEGDVEWWDYRSWVGRMRQPVAVGAFPEPFLHGFGGKRRPAWVEYDLLRLRPVAQALARRIHGTATRAGAPPGANVLEITSARVRFRGTGGQDRPVRFVISRRDAARLARNPRLARFRYEGLR